MADQGLCAEEDFFVRVPRGDLPRGDDLTPGEAATALAVFASFELPARRVRELRLAPTTIRVMSAESLRVALADMGFALGGAALFDLVSLADPSAIGVVAMQTWLDVVRHRKLLRREEERERAVRGAYIALGGTRSKSDKVALAPLLDVMQRFGIQVDTTRALEAIVTKRLAAVEEVLGMGGELDDEEMDEMKSTSLVNFDDLTEFARSCGGPMDESSDR